MDEITDLDFEAAAEKEFAGLLARAQSNPVLFAKDYWKLLDIIACYYQMAGANDMPEWVLDLLSDPEAATPEDIDKLQRLPNLLPNKGDE